MRDLSIYIHVPFCVRKCLYCDFLSFPVSEDRRFFYDRADAKGEVLKGRSGTGEISSGRKVQDYVNYLIQEIRAAAAQYRDHRVISVFWGGGTPSLLPDAAVRDVMESIRSYYHMAENVETTIEMNPGTADGDKLHAYGLAGINRISIGLQSADDLELQRIGRIHDYGTFLTTYDLVREEGFDNVNIDLISALPGQSAASYGQTLRRAAALSPEHISAYSLILEEGTPLYERQSDYTFPTEEEDREMYLYTKEYLDSCGYHRYEISNYALQGYECIHNKVYWQRGDYVGFGLGAASMVQNVRWKNPVQVDEYRAYVEKQAQSMTEMNCSRGDMQREEDRVVRQVLSVPEQIEEYMFLGLRLTCGISRQDFVRRFGQTIESVYGEILDQLYRQRLLVCDMDCVKLTDRGVDVSNYVMAQFLFDSN